MNWLILCDWDHVLRVFTQPRNSIIIRVIYSKPRHVENRYLRHMHIGVHTQQTRTIVKKKRCSDAAATSYDIRTTYYDNVYILDTRLDLGSLLSVGILLPYPIIL